MSDVTFDEVRAAERRLSPTQRDVILRFSDAEEWDRSGRGMARQWADLVAMRKWASIRTLRAMVAQGIAEEEHMGRAGAGFRLTPLGLSVQYRVRGMVR